MTLLAMLFLRRRIAMMNRIYIAGPMAGIKDFNFPEFDRAAEDLRFNGWEVFSPAERDKGEYGDDFLESERGDIDDVIGRGFDLRAALAADMEWIALNADAIFMLRGWENSKGAQAEWALAKALSLEIYYE
jgi:Domain of unknown function (DUF4406)